MKSLNILDFLNDFEINENFSLNQYSRFVNKLEDMISNIVDLEENQIENLKDMWFELEEINAVLLDEESEHKNVLQYKNDIFEICEKIKSFINYSKK